MRKLETTAAINFLMAIQHFLIFLMAIQILKYNFNNS